MARSGYRNIKSREEKKIRKAPKCGGGGGNESTKPRRPDILLATDC